MQPREEKPTSLEIIGGLSTMLIHDLTNAMTGISGNIQLARRCIGSPEKLNESLDSLQASCRRAGEIIRNFDEVRQSHAINLVEFELSGIGAMIETLTCNHPGWSAIIAEDLSGTVPVEEQWLFYSIADYLTGSGATQGSIRAHLRHLAVNASRDPQEVLSITLTFLVADSPRVEVKTPTRMACEEMLRLAGGWIDQTIDTDRTCHLVIHLPVQPAEEMP